MLHQVNEVLGRVFTEGALLKSLLGDGLADHVHLIHVIDVLVETASFHKVDFFHFLDSVNTLCGLGEPVGLESVLVMG